MIIEIKDTLTLDDNNQYVVASKINYADKDYYFLLNKNKTDYKFVYLDNDELVLITDDKTIKNLLPLFIKNAEKEIDIQ